MSRAEAIQRGLITPSRLRHGKPRRTRAEACCGKLRLTMEEAAARYGKPNYDGCEIYVCQCGYLHYGHTPRWRAHK